MRKVIYHLANALRKMGFDFHESDDIRVKKMQKAIKEIGAVEFKIEMQADGSWVAESTNIDGILTGGTTRQNMNSVIKDAIFTYFEIPPHLCNDTLMNSSSEPVTLEQRVYA